MKQNTVFPRRERRRRKSSLFASLIPAVMLAIAAVPIFLAGCGNDNPGGKVEYDPSKPVTLATFAPDSGHISDQILLAGSNFGRDISKIKVFFNKMEAAVIGSDGEKILALVPRLPGDTCKITVDVAGKTYEYPKRFLYQKRATVTTLLGNGNVGYDVTNGWLNVVMRPVFMGIDAEDNLFITDDVNFNLTKANPYTEDIMVVATRAQGMENLTVPTNNPKEGWMQTGSSEERDKFLTFKASDGFACVQRVINKWLPTRLNFPPMPGAGTGHDIWHNQLLYCPDDGYSYTRYNSGHVVRVNTRTWDAEVIGMTPKGYTFSFDRHPLRATELWLAYVNSDFTPNSICVIDVASQDSMLNFKVLSGPGYGDHRDGVLSQAMFNGMRQIAFDSSGNLFVNDAGNQCVRMIRTMENPMMVETLLGIPKLAGFKDGIKEDALFYQPHGMVVDSEGVLYVSDYGNARIRRIAIE